MAVSRPAHLRPLPPLPPGTRSVSTLTPSQLARKRANDREAQRAIRARTKEHIERLERELEEYRCNKSRDRTVQELLRRNRALEDEVRRLRDGSVNASITSSPYSAPAGTDRLDAPPGLARLTPCHSVYDDNLSVASSAMPSPQMSPLPSGPDYPSLPDYPQHQYVSLPKSCDSWASGLGSSVGSPCSSVNDTGYSSASAYIPTSMPASMMHGSSLGSAKEAAKMEYEDAHSVGHGYLPHHQAQHQSSHQQQSQSWSMYPVYYDAASPASCVSR